MALLAFSKQGRPPVLSRKTRLPCRGEGIWPEIVFNIDYDPPFGRRPSSRAASKVALKAAQLQSRSAAWRASSVVRSRPKYSMKCAFDGSGPAGVPSVVGWGLSGTWAGKG